MRTTLIALFALIIHLPGIAQEGEFKLKKEFPISATGTLHLRTDDARITIEGSDRKNAYVDVYRNLEISGLSWGSSEFDIEVDERGGDLYIRERKSSNYTVAIGSVREEYEIVIKLPRSVSLDLEGDDERYTISEINGSIEIDADDSDISMNQCKGNEFRIRLDDGDLELNGGTGNLVLDIDDGDAYIRDAQFTNVRVEMDDGDLELETSLADDGDYYIRSSDGRITIAITDGGGRFDISHDDGSLRLGNGYEIIEDSEHRKLIELPKGNARFRITADDARVILDNM